MVPMLLLAALPLYDWDLFNEVELEAERARAGYMASQCAPAPRPSRRVRCEEMLAEAEFLEALAKALRPPLKPKEKAPTSG